MDHRKNDWTNNGISNENSSGNALVKCNTKSKYRQTNSEICRNLEEINKNEFENMKQKLKINRKRVKCLLKIKCELQSELNKSIQTNMLMEQCITCPYIIKEGEMEFPGKNDLDKQFDTLFMALKCVKNDLKILQNKNCIVQELDHIFQLSLPECYDNCHKNLNEK